jgi:hypothetical protein
MSEEATSPLTAFYKKVVDAKREVEERLEMDLTLRRSEGQEQISLNERILSGYLAHLEKIYNQILSENNPFTRENVLEVYTPEAVTGLIHDSINFLGADVENERTGEVGLYHTFRLEDLDKLFDLRANSPEDLEQILNDPVIYGAASLGFLEISPGRIREIRRHREEARDYLSAYKNLPFLEKLKKYRRKVREEKFVNSSKPFYASYFLTSLGQKAVLPVKRESVFLADKERLFE